MHQLMKPIYEAASKLCLEFTHITEHDILEVKFGKKTYYIKNICFPLNNAASISLALNKYAMNRLLHDKGYSVANAIKISAEQWHSQPLDELVEGLTFPVVAKPMKDTARGTDVMCNIKNIDVLSDYFKRMIDKYPMIHIEEFKKGLKEYRVTVLKNKVVGVAQRFAPSVVGDGVHNIRKLIEIKNLKREIFSKVSMHDPLVYDEEYKLCLEEQGLSLDSIVAKDKIIRLCYTVNLGRGGDIYSLGTKINPQNKQLLCQLVRDVGLDYSGLDVLCEDINKPFKPGKWFILEANYSSDTTLHSAPPHGEKAPLAEDILKHLIFRHPMAYLCSRMINGNKKLGLAFIKIAFVIAFFYVFLYLI